MRFILFLILFIAEGWFISISAQDSEQRILEQLDNAISQKEKFKNDREAVISQIKQRLNYATDNSVINSVENCLICIYIIRLTLPATIFVVRNTTTLSSLNRRETSKSPSIGQK